MINSFSKETNDKVKELLIALNLSEKRVRIWYGDTTTGKSWNEEHSVIGRIGRSTGEEKIALLINNSRSFGGDGILTNCIIRIDEVGTRTTLYKHKNFHVDLRQGEEDLCGVYNEKNQNVANFSSPEKAAKYIDFMKGKRYSK
jgi:hypothetical protein